MVTSSPCLLGSFHHVADIQSFLLLFCSISDFLCIWNTNFQTLQAGKELAGRIHGQVGILGIWRFIFFFCLTIFNQITLYLYLVLKTRFTPIYINDHSFISPQVWCYLGKLFVPHGKALSVIPYECQKSSLASALGKLQHAGIAGNAHFLSKTFTRVALVLLDSAWLTLKWHPINLVI